MHRSHEGYDSRYICSTVRLSVRLLQAPSYAVDRWGYRPSRSAWSIGRLIGRLACLLECFVGCVVLCGVVWCRVVSCGVVWCRVVPCRFLACLIAYLFVCWLVGCVLHCKSRACSCCGHNTVASRANRANFYKKKADAYAAVARCRSE